MDTVAAILTALWTVLTNDSELRAIMGGTVRLYPDRAPANTPFPYLVHSIAPRMRDRDVWGLMEADYRLDLWDGPDASGSGPPVNRIYDMRRRIVELLDRADIPAPAGEFQGCRLRLEVDEPVPDDDHRVRHRHQIWVVRYWRTAEVEALLAEGR